MEYRINRRTGDKISVLGFGSSYIAEAEEKEAIKAIRRGFEGGINYFDLAAAEGKAFSCFGEALSDVRNKVMFQVHFGADYHAGEYGWTTDGETIKRSIDWQLKMLKTDYIDYGFIHCLDEHSDWMDYQKGGAFAFLKQMKEEGVVRHIGMSSHTPAAIMEIMDQVPVDMLMFSVNPGYDYQKEEYARGSADERTAVYQRCEKEGIGISVMKPFSGGQLLDGALSPFGRPLTIYQCLQYALDRPGVLTVLPGMSTVSQVEQMLGFFQASPEERDYSLIASFQPAEVMGKCVYCNHCQPCPAGLNIGLINKYYDLAKQGDAMAVQHYRGLEVGADACVGCGHCDRRCPFGVKQSVRMKEIAQYFAL